MRTNKIGKHNTSKYTQILASTIKKVCNSTRIVILGKYNQVGMQLYKDSNTWQVIRSLKASKYSRTQRNTWNILESDFLFPPTHTKKTNREHKLSVNRR